MWTNLDLGQSFTILILLAFILISLDDTTYPKKQISSWWKQYFFRLAKKEYFWSWFSTHCTASIYGWLGSLVKINMSSKYIITKISNFLARILLTYLWKMAGALNWPKAMTWYSNSYIGSKKLSSTHCLHKSSSNNRYWWGLIG